MFVIKKFFKNEHGATAIEYGLIAALISGVIIVALTAFGDETREMYDGLATVISNAINQPGG